MSSNPYVTPCWLRVAWRQDADARQSIARAAGLAWNRCARCDEPFIPPLESAVALSVTADHPSRLIACLCCEIEEHMREAVRRESAFGR